MKENRQVRRGPGRAAALNGRMLFVILIAALSAVAVMGCSRGTYPVDFFPEMHYNQSYKIQEPPSLSAPAGSVPVTGRELDYTMSQAKELVNPAPETASTISQGDVLYQVNCAVCHGVTAAGDGPLVPRLDDTEYGGRPPALTNAGPIANKSDGEVYQVISKGFGGAYGLPPDRFFMPAWEKLLTPAERWAIIRYLRSLD